MSKKCDRCGKQTSFLDGGSEYRRAYLCFECYEEVSKNMDEDIEKLGELPDRKETDNSYGQGYITLLRVVSWVELAITLILAVIIISRSNNLLAGVLPMIGGITVFAFLMVISWIAENVSEIRKLMKSNRGE